MSTAPDISLPRFEGPLDLLLSLVRKNQIDISDIPIAEITRQYLEYLHQADELNVDLGSDFVYMAGVLIHIKSKYLLPADPDLATAEPDPREELVRQLLGHDQMRQAAEFLKQKLEMAGARWSRPGEEALEPAPFEESSAPDGTMNLLQVLRMAQQALAAAHTYQLVTPNEPVSVEEMSCWLKRRLTLTSSPMEASALLHEQPDPAHRTALFLALLDMAKTSQIHLEQEQCFGPLWIERISR
jgi:segregation and condensation protein A